MSTGLDLALAGERGVECAAKRRMALRLDERFQQHFPALVGGAEQAHEGGVGRADAAFAIDRGDGDRRRMEQAGKSELGGAGLLGLAGAAAQNERMRQGPARSGAREAMQDAHRQAGAVGLDQIDIEAARGALALPAAAAGDQRRAVGGHDLFELERAAGDLGEVEAKPLRERRVEIFDGAVGVGGEEAGRRAVEIGDGRLHLGEACLLARAVHGDLIDLPHGERAFAARARVGRHRLHGDAEPARRDACLFLGFAGRRQAEFLLEAPPLLRRAGKAEDALGKMRVAGEGAVGRRHIRFGLETEQIAIGLVGVEHPPGAVGDQRALRQVVDKGFGDVVARMPAAEMQNADGAGEQAEHADHGKSGQDGEHERLGHLARHHGKADGGHRECQRQHHHEAHAAVSLGAVCGGRGVAHGHVDIGHGIGKIADFGNVLAEHCHTQLDQPMRPCGPFRSLSNREPRLIRCLDGG